MCGTARNGLNNRPAATNARLLLITDFTRNGRFWVAPGGFARASGMPRLVRGGDLQPDRPSTSHVTSTTEYRPDPSAAPLSHIARRTSVEIVRDVNKCH